MGLLFQKYLLLIFLFLPLSLLAQKKDSLRFTCLLNDATEPAPEKQGVDFGVKELKIVLSSATDTLVKACTDVVISPYNGIRMTIHGKSYFITKIIGFGYPA